MKNSTSLLLLLYIIKIIINKYIIITILKEVVIIIDERGGCIYQHISLPGLVKLYCNLTRSFYDPPAAILNRHNSALNIYKR